MQESTSVLIVGAGSIGERHLRNLLGLGYSNISVFRQRNLPLRTLDSSKLNILTTWEEVEKLSPEIVFICSPTALHLEQALSCAQMGAHIFVEKPLASTLDKNMLQQLRAEILRQNIHFQVGYMMRFHPLLIQIKEVLSDKRFGELISFHSHWGEFLPNWHPWEDYRQSYAARKDLGGGAALTLSHDLDVALWIVEDELDSYHNEKSYKNTLDIDVEGSVDMLLRFKNETIGNVHVNFVQRNPERRYEYRLEEATLKMDFFENSLTTYKGDVVSKQQLKDFDRNDLFIAQTKAFMTKVKSPDSNYSIAQLNNSETIISICNALPLT